MQGKKLFLDKEVTRFRLSKRVPRHNLYRRLAEVVFFKLVLVGRLENLVSDRRLVEHCALCLDILYFLGYEVDEELPWHSTVSHTRQLFPAAVFERLRDYAHEVLVPAGYDVRFDADVAGSEAPLPPAVRRGLYLIYKEALHNILKHTPAPATVAVALRREGPQLRLDIVNDGPPAAPPARRSGHGLRNIGERARVLGGQATAGPQPAGGFAVRVQVPA